MCQEGKCWLKPDMMVECLQLQVLFMQCEIRLCRLLLEKDKLEPGREFGKLSDVCKPQQLYGSKVFVHRKNISQTLSHPGAFK